MTTFSVALATAAALNAGVQRPPEAPIKTFDLPPIVVKSTNPMRDTVHFQSDGFTYTEPVKKK